MLKLIIVVLIAVVSGMYVFGFKPEDNNSQKTQIYTLNEEIKSLKSKLEQSEKTEKLKLQDRWVIMPAVMSITGGKDIEMSGNLIVYKRQQAIMPIEILKEVMLCQDLFLNACVIKKTFPLELGVFVK